MLPDSMRLALPTLAPDLFLVPWPRDEARRRRLEAGGLPRLLLIEGEVEPPVAADCLEDWIALPADAGHLWARVRTLRTHAGAHRATRPTLDHDGVLRFGHQVVSLGTIESRVTSALLAHFGALVTSEQLLRAGWPGTAPPRNALHRSIMRLRPHLAPLGLGIETVRGRGYVLAVDPFGPAVPPTGD